MNVRSHGTRKMFIVVAYDVADDRRRARLLRKLKGFGRHVQYSLFECILTPNDFERLKRVVNREIKEDEDLVRYYPLCESCRRRVLVINGEVTEEELTVIV